MLEHHLRNMAIEEHDSCGIICAVQKDGTPSHDNVRQIVRALVQMQHRAGFVDGEGDGCGIQLDIPRKLWAKKLTRQGVPGVLADDARFVVAHMFIPGAEVASADVWMDKVRTYMADGSIDILIEQVGNVRSDALGPRGLADEPIFWQIAAMCRVEDIESLGSQLFELQMLIERETPVHFLSFSQHTVVYKVRGSASALPAYFPDLDNKDCRAVVSIGHNRYSTNTSTIFERVQPFSILGHNGEINTIQKLREEAEILGFQLVPGGSDSQDMNRTIEGLIHRYGFSLFESMEMIFPPIVNEIKQFREELQNLYMFYRTAWGPYAQGPAGIVSRFADQCVFSVDALGLRPLWFVETGSTLFFSSEQGVVSLEDIVSDPKTLAPGEKIGVVLRRGEPVEVLEYSQLQNRVLGLSASRFNLGHFRDSLGFGASSVALSAGEPVMLLGDTNRDEASEERTLSAFGWDQEDVKLIEAQTETGNEPIRSLGHDGPLATLARERQNIADFFKESVAVVTNPAIDREREIEHFSTRVVIGRRPDLRLRKDTEMRHVEMQTPLILGGHRGFRPLTDDVYRPMAHKLGTYLFEDLLAEFQLDDQSVYELHSIYDGDETVPQAIERLGREAVEAVLTGAQLLVIDDCFAFGRGSLWIDPHLLVGAVHCALKNHPVPPLEQNLRRRVSIIVRSGAIRNLHDICVALGLGADGIAPYMMWEVAAGGDNAKRIENLYSALQKGLEKVISTIGIHELRGYDRLFASIGLRSEVAEVIDVKNFFGSDQGGYGWAEIEADVRDRALIASGAKKSKLVRTFHYWPRVWKVAGEVAMGLKPFEVFSEKMLELEKENPISIRHALDIRFKESSDVSKDDVDITVGRHSLPLLISSMSFGSQSEVAFRAYAEAAYQLDMISLNGEGGEIKDMIGKYPNHRGHQIASGRFGVNVELCNSANLLEIKIGQGAKPGEGGHLPGSKVSLKVANARNARPGVDLISPSNNHDIYSIEDLAQMIDELKTANPRARVAVKLPVVPGIGTIAVGVAKAGADIVTVSGYDGGTGAARAHALKNVGLPVEIGIKMAHRDLVAAGLRDKVEIWCDGGAKTGYDVLKMILLGANRVGFATMAMVAVGCTGCRACHKDTCHVGIATQVETMEEAEHKGMKVFAPREFENAVENLSRYFTGVGEELRKLTAQLGERRLQDLVGRSDLLAQAREQERLDLTDLLARVEVANGIGTQVPALRLSSVGVNSLTEQIANEAVLEAASGSETVLHQAESVNSHDRILGSYLSGTVTRGRRNGELTQLQKANLNFHSGSIAGNGLAAYNAPGVHVRVEGGAQDGVGKGAFGGKIIIMRGANRYGNRVNGSVGKGLAYGAQRGLFIIQGNADSRAGIRLSGADIVIGGEVTKPLQDELGLIGARANIKGFAFEYMTNGRALVMGDPGPWICSGMTGGTVYLRLDESVGLTEEALRRRIAKGAKVSLQKLDQLGKKEVEELLSAYKRELLRTGQAETAERVAQLLRHPERNFLMVKPGEGQTDQDIATE